MKNTDKSLVKDHQFWEDNLWIDILSPTTIIMGKSFFIFKLLLFLWTLIYKYNVF